MTSAAARGAPVVIMAGGTGGHVYPGIAVLQAFRIALGEQPHRFVWIGSQKGIERKVIEGLGYNISDARDENHIML